MFGSGIGIQKVSIKNSLTEIKKGKQPKDSPPTFEFIPHITQENYIIYSIPLTIQYQRKLKKWVVGIGGGGMVNFIKGEMVPSKLLKKYYNDQAGAKTYFENTKKSFASLFSDATIGYLLSSKIIFSTGITYNYALSSVYENSLYSPKINSFGIKIGLYYQFNLTKRR